MRRAIIAIAIAAAALAGAVGCSSGGGSDITLPHASCGNATSHSLSATTQFFAADRGALTCFTAAARTCKAVSLGVTEMGVDTGTDYVFAIASGGTPGYCVVNGYSQYYSAMDIGGLYTLSPQGGWVMPISTFRCSETAVTSQGVTLACQGPVQDETVLIPAAVSKHPGT